MARLTKYSLPPLAEQYAPQKYVTVAKAPAKGSNKYQTFLSNICWMHEQRLASIRQQKNVDPTPNMGC